MLKRSSLTLAILFLVLLCLFISGCSHTDLQSDSAEASARTTSPTQDMPEIPEDLALNSEGIPVLDVYETSSGQIREMDVETYLAGVLAGEMRNDWPVEALKAQAILARTFVMQFVDEKDSRYEDADISTDITEAQAYNAELINDKIRTAVRETRGLVMADGDDFAYAWFHAHAGGKTELPSVALDFKGGDPDYISIVESPDSEEAPDDVKNWTAVFPTTDVAGACSELGVNTGKITSIEIGNRGESGRAETFVINGKSVSAPSLRIRLDASKLKSTLIKSVSIKDDSVVFEGSGYGHGVGLSQWGAYALAKDGKNAEDIISHYFRNIDIVQLWN